MRDWLAAGVIEKLPHKRVSYLSPEVRRSLESMIKARVTAKEAISMTLLLEPIRAIIRLSADSYLLEENGGSFKVGTL